MYCCLRGPNESGKSHILITSRNKRELTHDYCERERGTRAVRTVASTVSVLRHTLPLLKEAKGADNEIRARKRERTSDSSVAIRGLRFERRDLSVVIREKATITRRNKGANVDRARGTIIKELKNECSRFAREIPTSGRVNKMNRSIRPRKRAHTGKTVPSELTNESINR